MTEEIILMKALFDTCLYIKLRRKYIIITLCALFGPHILKDYIVLTITIPNGVMLKVISFAKGAS